MIIYVASPHGGDKENIKRNAKYCRSVIRLGHTPISPHHNFIYLNEETERETALKHGKELIMACDEVWTFLERGRTAGMIAEEQYARSIGKPVFKLTGGSRRFCGVSLPEPQMAGRKQPERFKGELY